MHHLTRLALEANSARGVVYLVYAVLGTHKRDAVEAVRADMPARTIARLAADFALPRPHEVENAVK